MDEQIIQITAQLLKEKKLDLAGVHAPPTATLAPMVNLLK